MNRKLTIFIGILLISMGLIALGTTLILPLLGFSSWTIGVWRLWPLLVISLGAFLVVWPLLEPKRRGLGMLFIPGVPVLLTGGLLLFASFFNAWDIWRYAWPAELLALAVGFSLSAWKTGVVGLVVPAIIVGVNGLIFQFCALTGWWSAWAVLWALEPLSVGMALLALNLKLHKRGLRLAGMILCGLAAAGLIGMSFFLTSRAWIRVLGPLVLVGIGAIAILGTLRPQRPAKTS